VHAYALSTDHLHLLATPQTENALSLVMQALGRRYVSAYNRRHGRQGGLWVGRYRCAVLDPAQYLLDAMVFVEQHGVRAGRVTDPGDDEAASAAHHLGLRTDPLITDHVVFWTLGNTPFEREAAWRQRLAQGLTAARLQELVQAMRTGWALMSAEQAGKLEQAIGRRLMRRSRGRPRKAT
jgi:putative transposase